MQAKEILSEKAVLNGGLPLQNALACASRKHSGKNKAYGKSFQNKAEEQLSVPVVLEGSPKEKRKLTRIVNEMCRSEAGRVILESTAQAGYSLRFDKATIEEDVFGFADPEEKFCALNPQNSTEEAIVTLAHELRHGFQFESDRIFEISAYTHDTKTKMMTERALEADAEAYACLVSWELKETGHPAAWNDFIEAYPEIVTPFEKALKEGRGTDEARTAAFLGWYENKIRRDGYDQSHLDELTEITPQRLNKKLKSVSAQKLIAEICRDPQGPSYFKADPSILQSGKYLTVYDDVKRKIERFFDNRDRFQGRIPDFSLSEIQSEPRPKSKKKGKAVGSKAKNIIYQNKQTRAAKIIREKRQKIAPQTLDAALKKTAVR